MRAELVSRPAIGPMVGPFGRHVTHLRVSVTDRCDFRCVYCMSEHMVFLPTHLVDL
jgi:GTP 3',8-cyclase